MGLGDLATMGPAIGPAGFALFGGLLGAIIGSFLGAVLTRLPHGRSIVASRSSCESCGRQLRVAELVPILSFLVQRGRCRACGAAIDRGQLVCELAGAAIGALPWLICSDGLTAFLAMLMGWQLLLLGLLDLRHMWLPLKVVGLLALTGLAGAATRTIWLLDGDRGPVWIALAGGALGFGLLWLVAAVYRRTRGREGMGGGDPPLLGAIGLWLGPLGVVEVLLGGSIVGIAGALILLAAGRNMASDTALPFGSCLALAAWPLFLLQGFG